MPWFRRTKQDDAGLENPEPGASGPEEQQEEPLATDQGTTDPDLAPAVAGVNGLSAAWARRHRSGDDTAFSGLGCWVLLALLSQAAHGAARSELEAATRLSANRGMQGATSILNLLDSMDPLHAALSIWSRVVLDPEWVQALPAALVGDLTDDAEEDQRRVDAWVDHATGGELSRLPLGITGDTMLLLVSALALRVDWLEPFDEVGPFTDGAWAGLDVPQLVDGTSDLDRLRIAQTNVGPVTLLQVPAHEGIDVHLVRGEPDADAGAVLGAGIDALSALDGTAIPGSQLEDGEPAPGVVAETIDSVLPDDRLSITTAPFDIRASHDLLASPSLFGLTAATDGTQGHFPGLSPFPLAVDDARQDVTATFNRTGFRATAVTAIALGVGSARPPQQETHRVRRLSVTFDGPFGFVATHRASSLVLVAGWVHEPAPGEPADGDGEAAREVSS